MSESFLAFLRREVAAPQPEGVLSVDMSVPRSRTPHVVGGKKAAEAMRANGEGGSLRVVVRARLGAPAGAEVPPDAVLPPPILGPLKVRPRQLRTAAPWPELAPVPQVLLDFEYGESVEVKCFIDSIMPGLQPHGEVPAAFYSALPSVSFDPLVDNPPRLVGPLLEAVMSKLLVPAAALRFEVGDRVLANVGTWRQGQVVATDVEGFPYRIRLAEGDADVMAPEDTDRVVRKMETPDATSPQAVSDEDAAAGGRLSREASARAKARWALAAWYIDSGEALHPELFVDSAAQWMRWLHPAVAQWFAAGAPEEALPALVTEEAQGVYSLALMSDAFCTMLVAELENYEAVSKRHGWEVRRPNSMNNYGCVLNDMGLESLMDTLNDAVFAPLAAALFPGPGDEISGHHSFMVEYAAGADLGLDMHTDDSDVTFNLCLGKDFTGAGLQFCGLLGAADHRHHRLAYHHVVGRAVVHLGRQRHGADDIASGHRMNLIVWTRNRTWRRSWGHVAPLMQLEYERESGKPSPVCMSFTHDVDWEQVKGPRPRGTFMPWCPPEFARFAGGARKGGTEKG